MQKTMPAQFPRTPKSGCIGGHASPTFGGIVGDGNSRSAHAPLTAHRRARRPAWSGTQRPALRPGVAAQWRVAHPRAPSQSSTCAATPADKQLPGPLLPTVCSLIQSAFQANQA